MTNYATQWARLEQLFRGPLLTRPSVDRDLEAKGLVRCHQGLFHSGRRTALTELGRQTITLGYKPGLPDHEHHRRSGDCGMTVKIVDETLPGETTAWLVAWDSDNGYTVSAAFLLKSSAVAFAEYHNSLVDRSWHEVYVLGVPLVPPLETVWHRYTIDTRFSNIPSGCWDERETITEDDITVALHRPDREPLVASVWGGYPLHVQVTGDDLPEVRQRWEIEVAEARADVIAYAGRHGIELTPPAPSQLADRIPPTQEPK